MALSRLQAKAPGVHRPNSAVAGAQHPGRRRAPCRRRLRLRFPSRQGLPRLIIGQNRPLLHPVLCVVRYQVTDIFAAAPRQLLRRC